MSEKSERKKAYMKEYAIKNRERLSAYNREFMRKKRHPKYETPKPIKPRKKKLLTTIMPKAIKLTDAQQQIQARAIAGMEPAKGKSYKEYVREAMARKNTDRVYKRFLNKRSEYNQNVEAKDDSFEKMKDNELGVDTSNL